MDEGALVSARIHGHGTGSGVIVDQRGWHVLTVRDGKVAWWQIFRSETEALAAAGLEPDDDAEGPTALEDMTPEDHFNRMRRTK